MKRAGQNNADCKTSHGSHQAHDSIELRYQHGQNHEDDRAEHPHGDLHDAPCPPRQTSQRWTLRHSARVQAEEELERAYDRARIERDFATQMTMKIPSQVGKPWVVSTLRVISSLTPNCGGLPAPENSDNPLGYKFSWSPRGVLLAARNTAQYYKDGKKETTPGDKLMSTAKPYQIYPGYAFEAYPNRDSTPFRERYNIPEAQTLIRGTLRYQGNPAFVQTLRDLGLLSEDKHDFMQNPDATWKESFAKIVGSSSSSDTDLVWAVSSKTKFADNDEKERILAGLRWVGLFSDDKIGSGGNPLDCLCGSLEKKMQYEKGERDFVMLQHKFGIEWADGRHETRTSTLCEYGEPEGSGGYSAMAKLVGVPCAVAVQMVLSGEIKDKGILAPVTPELAEPIRVKLQKDYGIELIEKTLA
ncbi:saccharopine dehydrogenase (NADP+, L-glutamate-forming) [Friedmanniomyces endolithicus]|nr:saccharopine dehydrogenase (NADP+, L-glutamate-forming) [Friedmanniomyces endolithicus]KAK0798996.1 saccharopine dehydrogenase (NADP+, L-glutamate-forming) [Friedmanniomyces endolithicus]KAK0803564.1 saccharopine dehydrogenase (NADP+, L-glutamate-forming) [Friedmanniomyces endolithicus]